MAVQDLKTAVRPRRSLPVVRWLQLGVAAAGVGVAMVAAPAIASADEGDNSAAGASTTQGPRSASSDAVKPRTSTAPGRSAHSNRAANQASETSTIRGAGRASGARVIAGPVTRRAPEPAAGPQSAPDTTATDTTAPATASAIAAPGATIAVPESRAGSDSTDPGSVINAAPSGIVSNPIAKKTAPTAAALQANPLGDLAAFFGLPGAPATSAPSLGAVPILLRLTLEDVFTGTGPAAVTNPTAVVTGLFNQMLRADPTAGELQNYLDVFGRTGVNGVVADTAETTEGPELAPTETEPAPRSASRRASRQIAPVIPAAAVAPALGASDSSLPDVGWTAAAAEPALMTSLPAPRAMAAAGTDLLVQVNAAVTTWFDSSANWLAGLPANPVSEFLEGALLLVRRSLFNQIPTSAPVQIKTLVNGQIEGTLGAVDPEGDILSYVLTGIPQQGTVQINPDGTYVYTPGPDDPGYDRFTVAVNDGGFNILNPSGSWRPAQAVARVGDDGVDPGGLISRGLTIYNLTGSPLTLTSFNATRTVNNVAPIGTVLQPGEHTKVILAQYAFVNNFSTLVFTPTEGASAEPFQTYFQLEPLATNWGCTGLSSCETNGSTTNGTARLILLDAPGTVISVPSGQGQKQADVLNQLCGSSSASCTYTPKSFDDTAFTDWKLASDSVSNNTSSNLTTTITVTTSRSTTTGLKLTTSVKSSILDIVEVAVTAEASQTWTNTYTFSQAITVTAQPGEKVSIESRDPVKRVTGDFTLVMRNTTWNLYDVNFDSPDADRRSEYNAITTPISTGM